jgi:uncharacterized membrane protein
MPGAGAGATLATTRGVAMIVRRTPGGTAGPSGNVPAWLIVALATALLALGAALLLGTMEYVSAQLGLDAAAALAVLWASLIGSRVDIPVARIHDRGAQTAPELVPTWAGLLVRPGGRVRGTLVAVNVGGAVIPVAVSFVVVALAGAWWEAGAATAVVAVIAYVLARVVPGVGVLLPFWATPLTAALTAVALAPGASAAVAYAGATLGTLVGADLLHLHRAGALRATVVSIGGAGTFDGIFLGGIVAVLLAGV